MITGKYMTGFDPNKPEEITKAWERGLLRTTDAIELLEKFQPWQSHDHKDSCVCGQARFIQKEMEKSLKDEGIELEIAVARGK